VDAKDILKDAFGRLPDLVRDAVQDLSPDQLRWAPAETANPIGWLVWHLTGFRTTTSLTCWTPSRCTSVAAGPRSSA